MAISVNGVAFTVYAGKSHNLVVKCPKCSRTQLYSTNQIDCRKWRKRCVNCGYQFTAKTRIVKEDIFKGNREEP